MMLIVGLGNPGEKYQYNRHNAGFLYLDFLFAYFTSEGITMEWENSKKFKASVCSFTYNGKKLTLLKPQTFMNDSGVSVGSYMAWSRIKPSEILLVHDDLDIPLGMYKYNTQKSPKIHNGILSVEKHVKTKEFTRLRIGVDNRQGIKENGIAYVLSDFSQEEEKT